MPPPVPRLTTGKLPTPGRCGWISRRPTRPATGWRNRRHCAGRTGVAGEAPAVSAQALRPGGGREGGAIHRTRRARVSRSMITNCSPSPSPVMQLNQRPCGGESRLEDGDIVATSHRLNVNHRRRQAGKASQPEAGVPSQGMLGWSHSIQARYTPRGYQTGCM